MVNSSPGGEETGEGERQLFPNKIDWLGTQNARPHPTLSPEERAFHVRRVFGITRVGIQPDPLPHKNNAPMVKSSPGGGEDTGEGERHLPKQIIETVLAA
jgi:hypothetical protein